MKNKLLIAGAGAGKTTYFVNEALKCESTVLITTFTEANEKEIRKKFFELNNGVIPANITIRTWFSFLIESGAKPYQGSLTNKKINGMLLVSRQSATGISEKNIDKHYFTNDYRIYSDKLAKFVVKCDELSGKKVFDRISRIYKNIFIDEVQDLAGYDLEIIKLLFATNSNIVLAGDPRQVTYHTNNSKKNKKYINGDIVGFIENECKSLECNIDRKTLINSWRNNQKICDLANKIFPVHPQCMSNTEWSTEHDGIFLVEEKYIEEYLCRFNPLQLRYNRRTKNVNLNYQVKNFGESKGLTVDRVLIYPTGKISDYILKGKELDTFETRCKLYVAITRAKYSVAIICKNGTKSNDYSLYKPNSYNL